MWFEIIALWSHNQTKDVKFDDSFQYFHFVFDAIDVRIMVPARFPLSLHRPPPPPPPPSPPPPPASLMAERPRVLGLLRHR